MSLIVCNIWTTSYTHIHLFYALCVRSSRFAEGFVSNACSVYRLYACIQSPAFTAAGQYGQCNALSSWFLVAVEMLLVLA